MNLLLRTRKLSTLLHPTIKNPNSPVFRTTPIPDRTLQEPKGQDLDYINVAHSHLLHSDWPKLDTLLPKLDPFRVKHILLKIQNDYSISLKFFKWVELKNPNLLTLETNCIIIHILTKNRKFVSAESVFNKIFKSCDVSMHSKVFDSIVCCYRMCDSTPRVFDALFKTYAQMKQFRNAADTFSRMKGYGFLPTVESWKLEDARQVFDEMPDMGFSPNVSSYNTLVAAYVNRGLLATGVKLKVEMEKNGVSANVITYNTLMNGFCKEGKLHDAYKVFHEIKVTNVAPNTVTYNTMISGYCKLGKTEKGTQIFEEMLRNGVKADILTYNALLSGLCDLGKTRKAAYLVQELDKKKLVPNSSTFAALIRGQCVRKNPDRAFQLYKSMIKSGCRPNVDTIKMMMSCFVKNDDFDGAFCVFKEMLDRRAGPDSVIWSALCEGFSREWKDQLVMSLLKEVDDGCLTLERFEKAKSVIFHSSVEGKEIAQDV
ncbi:putative tetratricopeptide-like helical domain superfamily [Helianthus annuus]|nr:putative tetratricopeptide-like helical domain superfamily [Helianthus annuus]